MRQRFLIVLLVSFTAFSQEKVNLSLLDSTNIGAENIYGADAFGTYYYDTKDYTFHKKTKDTTITYTNFQLGKISTADTFNPLKMVLFYRDFNTVVILDNRLAEIYKIDFNTLSDYKNVSHTTTGYDNTLWIFNMDLQQLELYDYLADNTRIKTVPIQSKVIDLKSNYNYCFLLTEEYLYIYNYFGSLLNKIENNGYTNMAITKNIVVLKNENHFGIIKKNADKIEVIESPDLLINQFFVTNESLYIYSQPMLKKYQLKIQ